MLTNRKSYDYNELVDSFGQKKLKHVISHCMSI